jgi:site-specific recombinase XerD
MHRNQLQNINPNRLHGCHPLGLHGVFSDHPFHLIAEKPKTAPEKISPRLKILEKILKEVSFIDFPAKDHFAGYMRERYRRNCKPNTLRNAAASLKQFLTFYGQSGKGHIEQMTREDIEAFTEDLQDRGLKAVTVSNRLRTVYAFVRFLIEAKVLDYELLERKIRIRLPDRLPRAIDPDDLKQLLSAIGKVRDRAMILLLLRTGMRIGELLNTKVHDLDLNNHRILIYESDKTGVGRVAYYSDDAREALMSWLQVRNTFKEYLFYGRGDQPICYETARSIFMRCLKNAGLEYSGYTLHCLRHTFATEL